MRKKQKKSQYISDSGPKMQRITVHIDIDKVGRKLTVKHPAFGVNGSAGTEAELRYLLGEFTFHLGEYIWEEFNPWNGEDDDD